VYELAGRARLMGMLDGCPDGDGDPCHALIDGVIGAGAVHEVAPTSGVATITDPDGGRDRGRPPSMPELGFGTRVGRYVIGQRLGMGGMGIVYSAIDSELHRWVALKLLRSDRHGGASDEGRERLMREARTLARLSHPNVVTVFDVGEHLGDLFIAIELVGGGSLSAWLQRAPRSADEVIDRMLEAGRGLAAAHAAGIVHRDIKPDNILVGLDGRARVTDFGLARLGDQPSLSPAAATGAGMLDPSHRLTRSDLVVGTPAYMAPEQRTHGTTDAHTDQWSFCATLHEALAGERLAATRAPAAPGAGCAAKRAPRRVPRWVQKIVMRGLHVDPAARWPSMDALLAELARGRHRWRAWGRRAIFRR
jgi:serine/threonine protein kinase